MSYNDPYSQMGNAWDWTNQSQPVAPLSALIQPSQASPAQVTQGQPGIIDGFVKPMATAKATNYANTKIVSPLFDTIGSDMSALGAGITGDMSAANVGNSIAANMTADPMGALVANYTTPVVAEAAVPVATNALSTAGPISAAATGTTAAANAWNPLGWAAGIYGAGKLLKIW